jgi:hypothetical protein
MHAIGNTNWTDTEPTNDKMFGSPNGILTTTYQWALCMGTLHVDGAIIINYILYRREVLKCGVGEGSRGSAEPIV